jgi:hypothetical protein
MSMTDDSLRISVVIHRSLDPEVFELLSSIGMPKVRSEYARRLLRDGALREFKSKKQGRAPNSAPISSGRQASNSNSNRKTAPVKGQGASDTPVPVPVSMPPLAVFSDAFVDDFVSGITAVPSR